MNVNETSHILCVDTSSRLMRLALLFSGDRLVQSENEVERSHGQILLKRIENLFESAGLSKNKLNGIVVALGPGSFTGLRIGLAAVKGMAIALEIPIVGVSFLELAAYKLQNQPFDCNVVLPFKKGEYFLASVVEGKCEIESVEIVTNDILSQKINSQRVYAIGDESYFQQLLGIELNIELLDYNASDILHIGREKLLSGIENDIATLEPMYLAKSAAEIKHDENRKN